MAIRVSLPSANLPTFSACQFAELQSADCKSLARANWPVIFLFFWSTLMQTLTSLSTDHFLERLFTCVGEPLETWRFLSCNQLSDCDSTGHHKYEKRILTNSSFVDQK